MDFKRYYRALKIAVASVPDIEDEILDIKEILLQIENLYKLLEGKS